MNTSEWSDKLNWYSYTLILKLYCSIYIYIYISNKQNNNNRYKKIINFNSRDTISTGKNVYLIYLQYITCFSRNKIKSQLFAISFNLDSLFQQIFFSSFFLRNSFMRNTFDIYALKENRNRNRKSKAYLN